MGRRNDWLPLRDDDFYNKQRAYFERIVANKVAWGIPDSAIAPLLALQAEYEPLYWKVQDKKTRTGGDVVAHRDCRKRYAAAWRSFHKEWVVNNSKISKADKVILVGKERDTEPSPRPKITDIPIVGFKPLGGGSIEVTCMRETDQTRPSIQPDADGIECRYTFVPKREMPPKSWEDCSRIQTSKKARFIISCGVENAGHSFYGFFRWVNLTTPDNSGPWTNTQGAVIA
jgi:hypothetical protein